MEDVVIVGGGPAGLAAALALGRAQQRVVLCDAGPRRNAAAVHIHNFVTRDGTTPQDFRAAARAQLAAYSTVRVKDAGVATIAGEKGNFVVEVNVDGASEVVRARRVLLATGMIDTRLPVPGFDALWGKSIFQCPYCHGHEVRGQRWGFLVTHAHPHVAMFALQLRSFNNDVVVFGDLADDARASLARAGVRVLASPVRALHGTTGLESVELADGTREPCTVLFAHPPQHQVPVVAALGVDVDEDGFVRADPMTKATSLAGVYAAGDLTSRMQGAIFAAAAGTHAAAMITMDLAMERAAPTP